MIKSYSNSRSHPALSYSIDCIVCSVILYVHFLYTSCAVVAVEMLDAKKIRKMSQQSATLFDSYFFKFVMF